MRPTKTSPIVYENYMKFDDFINMLFIDEDEFVYKLFRQSTSYMKQIIYFLTIHLLHLDIQDQEVWFLLFRLMKGLLTISCGKD